MANYKRQTISKSQTESLGEKNLKTILRDHPLFEILNKYAIDRGGRKENLAVLIKEPINDYTSLHFLLRTPGIDSGPPREFRGSFQLDEISLRNRGVEIIWESYTKFFDSVMKEVFNN